MARTNANFNLSKSTKRVLATIADKNQRTIFRNAMIDAENSFIVNKTRRPRENNQELRQTPKD